MALVLALVAFGGGTWLLVESVEGLVGALGGWAAASGLSGLALAAVVLGLDLESTAAGVAATLGDLPGTALGTSVGAAIFLVTVGLGLAALVAPFTVRTPRRVLLAAAAATALPLALAADGILSRVDGALLAAGWLPALAVLVAAARGAREEGAPRGTRPRRLALRLLGGLAGLVVGAELLVWGARGVVGGLGLSETAFGLLVVGAAVSLEELVLALLPAQRGHPEIGVGNALGTLVFLLTASLGVIALVRPVVVPPAVTAFHGPALAVAVALASLLLLRGCLGRGEGALLVAAYAVYATGALVAGG